jgi:hypothetical protein
MTVKAGLIVRLAKLVAVKKAKNVKDIQLVDQQWLNVQMPQKRKKDLSVLAGKMIE